CGGRVQGEETQVTVQQGREALHRCAGRRRCLNGVDDVLLHARVRRHEAILLGREVLVEGRLGDAGRRRQVVDRGVAVALLGHDRGERLEQPLLLVGGDLFPGEVVTAGGEPVGHGGGLLEARWRAVEKYRSRRIMHFPESSRPASRFRNGTVFENDAVYVRFVWSVSYERSRLARRGVERGLHKG